eukprot:3303114-Amphidinium_carterae.1
MPDLVRNAYMLNIDMSSAQHGVLFVRVGLVASSTRHILFVSLGLTVSSTQHGALFEAAGLAV